MTRPKSPPSSITDVVKQMQKLYATGPVVFPPAEHFWQAQEDILGETEAFARHWFERRHTATRTALETARKISEKGPSDPVGAIQAMADWQAHSMERMAEDLREWLDLWSRCAAHMTRAEVETGQEGLEKLAKSAASTRRKKDDVPV